MDQFENAFDMEITEQCWVNLVTNFDEDESLDIFSDGATIVCRKESDAYLIAHLFSAITGNNKLIYMQNYEFEDHKRWSIDFE